MKKSTVILLWGAITGVAYSLFYQILNSGDTINKTLAYVGYLIIFGGLLAGTLQYRKANGGYLSFGEGYKAGILMTLVVAVIACISFAIFLQIHPDFPQKMADLQKDAMINKGFNQQQIDMAMSMTKKFKTPAAMLIFSFLGSVLCGAIISLLTAGITSKARPMIMDDDINPVQ